MKRKLLGLLALTLILTVIACNSVTEGTVVKKSFVPAYDWYWLMPIYMTSGKSTTVIYIPMIVHEPDRWYVTIQGTNEKGRVKKAKYTVKHECYDRIGVGDFYRYSKVDQDCTESTKERQK